MVFVCVCVKPGKNETKNEVFVSLFYSRHITMLTTSGLRVTVYTSV